MVEGYNCSILMFAVVSRAFQILSDADKKSRYDQFGGDPDNRFSSSGASAAGASPFSGFARSPGGGRGPFYEDEISPEELFNRFFGGGMGGGGGFNFGESSFEYWRCDIVADYNRRRRLRRTSIRFQHGWWTRLHSTSHGRWCTTTKAERSDWRRDFTNGTVRTDSTTALAVAVHSTATLVILHRWKRLRASSSIRFARSTTYHAPSHSKI